MELSKRKHVYRIYSSSDGVVHCERFKIIYSNSEYVYFKSSRRSTLDYISTNKIKEVFSKDEWNMCRVGHNGVLHELFFYNVKDFDSEKVTYTVFYNEKKEKIKEAQKDVDWLKGRYDNAVKKLEELKQKFE